MMDALSWPDALPIAIRRAQHVNRLLRAARCHNLIPVSIFPPPRQITAEPGYLDVAVAAPIISIDPSDWSSWKSADQYEERFIERETLLSRFWLSQSVTEQVCLAKIPELDHLRSSWTSSF
jgi:hypothetical protein